MVWKQGEEATMAEARRRFAQRSEKWSEHYQRLAAERYEAPHWWYLDDEGQDMTRIYGPYKRAAIRAQSTEVTCWPSTGGFWTKRLGHVDLDFLGLDRLHDTPRSAAAAEEDRFCSKLCKFGSTWYESESRFRYSVNGDPRQLDCEIPECPPPTPQKLPVFYRYPSTGGLWVLELVHKEELRREGVGKLKNVFSMEERVQVIEKLDGRYFADPEVYWKMEEKKSWRTPEKDL